MARIVEISRAESQAIAPPVAEQQKAARTWAVPGVTIAALLLLMVVAGLGLRLSGIERVGFAEDEINKLEAVRAYRRGDIRPNAEHPMLMKALIFFTLGAARAWDGGGVGAFSDEAAVRFPNVLFGALTVIPLFLLTAAFFDRRTALVAAGFWAFGVNAITYNRIAKEDTLLVFFTLSAFYFYLRAKQTSGDDQRRKRWYYGWSGASFGLMLASKYFPHYFGLNMLYHHLFRVRERAPGEAPGKTPPLFYALVLAVFLAANPAVILPDTWAYLQSYTSEQLIAHTGYLMGDHLYKNNMSSTPFWGTPGYFYLLFLAIKVPLPVTAALVVGLFVCARRPRRPGHAFLLLMFILWVVPYSLAGAKWLRYALSLMPFVYMIGAVGVMWIIRRCAAGLKERGAERLAPFAVTVVLVVFIALPAWAAYRSAPHYAAYTNALGGGQAGRFFPHDEFYDDGLREAISYVAEKAQPGAAIVHETPGVVRYYLEKYGRTDLQSRVMSDPQFNAAELQGEAYVILQRGRTYFENQEEMNQVRANFARVYAACVRGAAAAEVYAARDDQGGAPVKSCAGESL